MSNVSFYKFSQVAFRCSLEASSKQNKLFFHFHFLIRNVDHDYDLIGVVISPPLIPELADRQMIEISITTLIQFSSDSSFAMVFFGKIFRSFLAHYINSH